MSHSDHFHHRFLCCCCPLCTHCSFCAVVVFMLRLPLLPPLRLLVASTCNIHELHTVCRHLSKSWRTEWGGALYWIPSPKYFHSSFNTLYLFSVTPNSQHFVTHVTHEACEKRLAFNGMHPQCTQGGYRPVLCFRVVAIWMVTQQF